MQIMQSNQEEKIPSEKMISASQYTEEFTTANIHSTSFTNGLVMTTGIVLHKEMNKTDLISTTT